MGSIPEYNRQQLASSYVGAAQKDNSTALAIGAVQEAVEPVFKDQLQKLKEREDLVADQRVNNLMIDYSLQVEKEAAILRQENAAYPEEYSKKVIKMAQDKATAMAKDVPNARIQNGFLKASGSAQRAMIPGAVSWSFQKQEDNAVTAVVDSTRLISRASSASMNSEAFAANLGALHNSVYLTPGNLIDEKDKQTLYMKSEKDCWEAYASNRLATDPFGFAKELKSNKYTDFKYSVQNSDGSVSEKTLSLEGTDITKYVSLAENAAALSDVKRAQNKLYEDAGALSTLTEKYYAGEATLKDIATTDAVVQNDPKATPETKEYSKALLKVATSKHTQTAVDNPVVIDRIQMKAAAIEQKKTKTKAKDMITDILKLKTEIENEAAAGNITNGTSGILRKLIEPTYLGVLKQDGKTLWFGKSDPYAGQYARVIDRVKKMNLTGDRFLEAKVWAFSKFAEQVYEAEQKGRTIGNEDLDSFLETSIRSTQGQMFPGSYKYKIGEVISTKAGAFKVIGYNDDGDVLLDTGKDVEDKLKAMK